MQIDIVPTKGLLDHQQIEVVEFAQQFGMIESIGLSWRQRRAGYPDRLCEWQK